MKQQIYKKTKGVKTEVVGVRVKSVVVEKLKEKQIDYHRHCRELLERLAD